MSILYHGTTKENADIIIKEGFKKGTFFARHLESSLHYGGDYIFEVLFEYDTGEYWEYVTDVDVPVSMIRSYYKLPVELILHNKECERRIREINIKEMYGDEAKFCETCEGRGQMEYYPPFTRWRDREKITVCSVCKGEGYVKEIKK